MKEQTWKQWVRAVQREKKTNPNHRSKLFDGCMAPLTGTDSRALDAFVPAIKLYSYTGDSECLLSDKAQIRVGSNGPLVVLQLIDPENDFRATVRVDVRRGHLLHAKIYEALTEAHAAACAADETDES